ncbi:MAG TPA: hypothetical protein VJG90_07800 [Candidatus Nanoarchaeia archaeon]|nr:hypothetical protein [Candidatus Nanoarchaeia archaeon]
MNKAGYLVLILLLILCLSIVGVAASDAPVSFYDPTTRQNRPIWWIQQNAPSLFYSVDRIEQISQSPLFIKANEGKLDTLRSVLENQQSSEASLARLRRAQGLTVIEEGVGEAKQGSRAVVGVSGDRFEWNRRHGIQGEYKKSVGLVGYLAEVFSKPKNEMHRVRSTYYLREQEKENPQEVFKEEK